MFSPHLKRTLGRIVVVWFVLFVGVAGAFSWRQAGGLEVVCSGTGGVKLLLDRGDQPAKPLGTHALECVLCLPCGAPPPPHHSASAAITVSGSPAPAPRVGQLLILRSAAPLLARGPPLLGSARGT